MNAHRLSTATVSAPSPSLVSTLRGVRVPTQHGIFALALLAGALLGALLGGGDHVVLANLSSVLQNWLPAAASDAVVVGAVVGAVTAGLTAWLVCRPRRTQKWTIDYPQNRMIGLRGVTS